jgi:hypothetical protein
MYSRNCSNKDMKIFIAKKMEFIEDIISMESSEENINIVNKYLKDLKNLNDVLRSLKKNKTRDPLGEVNMVFKPKVIGEQLEQVLLSLLNDIKLENLIPILMQLANISSIWKRKGSKKSLENNRGIFVLCVL